MALFTNTSLSGLFAGFDSQIVSKFAGLIDETKWSGNSLSFAFTDASADYGIGYGNGEAYSGFEQADANLQETTREILAQVERITGFSFSENAANLDFDADIRIAKTDRTQTAFAYLPSSNDEAGDAWFSSTSSYFNNYNKGGYAYFTVMHELGHALGLKHGHEDEVYGALDTELDGMPFSVMTYRSHVGADTNYYTNGSSSYAQSFMSLDIAALQSLYGVNWDTESGDTTYSWNASTGTMLINGIEQLASSGKIFETLWDGGGRDLIDLENFDDDAVIDLNPGAGSRFDTSALARLGSSTYADANIYLPYLPNNSSNALFEAAITGGGDDEITGNTADNRLSGRDGSDVISGGQGDDKLFGNKGNDELNGAAGNDILRGNANSDTLYGNSGNDRLFGGTGRDRLFGGEGNDRLAGGKGMDVLTGGNGADIFIFEDNNATDKITDFDVSQDRIQIENGANIILGARGKSTTLQYEEGTLLILKGVDSGDVVLDDILFS